jgi:hypothetical protein
MHMIQRKIHNQALGQYVDNVPIKIQTQILNELVPRTITTEVLKVLFQVWNQENG